ncbi:snaclec bothroinsularin subunit alpha-like [Python bivittatus]|uniref:Snaclec bothroinsularin subunit alpha-like n=1 Tax=Python bivittatus TaxID=176946 RepID=A0A9F5J4N3_PYTBI|nr:snaclec bothroinsularin subunit alpha-like [Python bivittatus]
MKLQILLCLFLTTLVLPFSEGHGAQQIKHYSHWTSFLNPGVQNNLPPVKHEALVVPDDDLENQKSFCQAGCRDGWISYTDHCYMYVQEQLPWAEAERSCHGLAPGGHLTSISSAEHNAFLVNMATYQARKPGQCWTGGNQQKGNNLQWTDGTAANFIQRPLSSIFHIIGGTLNQILSLNIHLCLNINIGGHGQWDGTNCQKKLPFICSYKPYLAVP